MTIETTLTSDTIPVRETHRFDVDALECYLAPRIPGFRGPVTVSQFQGGQSNPTYRLSAAGHEYVLRRKPPGKLLPSAHAVDREYRILTALGQTDVPDRLHAARAAAERLGLAFAHRATGYGALATTLHATVARIASVPAWQS